MSKENQVLFPLIVLSIAILAVIIYLLATNGLAAQVTYLSSQSINQKEIIAKCSLDIEAANESIQDVNQEIESAKAAGSCVDITDAINALETQNIVPNPCLN